MVLSTQRAVIKIQCAWRCYRAFRLQRRRKFTRSTEETDEELAVRYELAAMTLQLFVRHIVSRRRLRDRRMSFQRRTMKVVVSEEHRAALVIQCTMRGRLARARVAMMHQRLGSNNAARIEYEASSFHDGVELDQEGVVGGDKKSSVQVTASSTGRTWSTDPLNVPRALDLFAPRRVSAAVRIQCMWRCFLALNITRRKMFERIAQETEEELFLKHDLAAVTLQLFARHIIAKRVLAERREATRRNILATEQGISAVTIQSQVRHTIATNTEGRIENDQLPDSAEDVAPKDGSNAIAGKAVDRQEEARKADEVQPAADDGDELLDLTSQDERTVKVVSMFEKLAVRKKAAKLDSKKSSAEASKTKNPATNGDPVNTGNGTNGPEAPIDVCATDEATMKAVGMLQRLARRSAARKKYNQRKQSKMSEFVSQVEDEEETVAAYMLQGSVRRFAARLLFRKRQMQLDAAIDARVGQEAEQFPCPHEIEPDAVAATSPATKMAAGESGRTRVPVVVAEKEAVAGSPVIAAPLSSAPASEHRHLEQANTRSESPFLPQAHHHGLCYSDHHHGIGASLPHRHPRYQHFVNPERALFLSREEHVALALERAVFDGAISGVHTWPYVLTDATQLHRRSYVIDAATARRLSEFDSAVASLGGCGGNSIVQEVPLQEVTALLVSVSADTDDEQFKDFVGCFSHAYHRIVHMHCGSMGCRLVSNAFSVVADETRLIQPAYILIVAKVAAVVSNNDNQQADDWPSSHQLCFADFVDVVERTVGLVDGPTLRTFLNDAVRAVDEHRISASARSTSSSGGLVSKTKTIAKKLETKASRSLQTIEHHLAAAIQLCDHLTSHYCQHRRLPSDIEAIEGLLNYQAESASLLLHMEPLQPASLLGDRESGHVDELPLFIRFVTSCSNVKSHLACQWLAVTCGAAERVKMLTPHVAQLQTTAKVMSGSNTKSTDPQLLVEFFEHWWQWSRACISVAALAHGWKWFFDKPAGGGRQLATSGPTPPPRATDLSPGGPPSPIVVTRAITPFIRSRLLESAAVSPARSTQSGDTDTNTQAAAYFTAVGGKVRIPVIPRRQRQAAAQYGVNCHPSVAELAGTLAHEISTACSHRASQSASPVMFATSDDQASVLAATRSPSPLGNHVAGPRRPASAPLVQNPTPPRPRTNKNPRSIYS